MPENEGKWIPDAYPKLQVQAETMQANETTGWSVSLCWILAQAIKQINEAEKEDEKYLFISVRNREGKFLDPKREGYDLYIRGIDEEKKINMREEFPPIKFP